MSESEDQSFDEEEEPEESEEEEQPTKRRHIRRYKSEDVMLAECERYVKERKRLPILHSRWLLNRFVNDHNTLIWSVPEHNRVVDDRLVKTTQLFKAHRKLDRIAAVVEHLKHACPALSGDEQFQELERLVNKDSSPRYDQP